MNTPLHNVILSNISVPDVAETGEHVKGEIAQQFSQCAARYDNCALVQQKIAQWAMSQVSLSMSNNKVTTAVDLGCATGKHTAALQQFATIVVGLDIAPGMLNFAQHTSKDGINWLTADMENMPLAAGSIDLLYSNMAMQWVSDTNRFAREVHRVLSESGIAVLVTMLDGSFAELNQAFASISGEPLSNKFHAVSQWRDSFVSTDLNLQIMRKTFIDWHSDMSSLMHSITDIGASTNTSHRDQNALTPSRYKLLRKYYQKNLAVNQQLPLSYDIGMFVLTKNSSLHSVENITLLRS